MSKPNEPDVAAAGGQVHGAEVRAALAGFGLWPGRNESAVAERERPRVLALVVDLLQELDAGDLVMFYRLARRLLGHGVKREPQDKQADG